MLNVSDLNELGGNLVFLPEDKEYPKEVKGRTAHIDADFMAYHASYEREGEDRTFEDMVLATNTMITDLRRSCGAEFAVLHTTPSGSDKAGRYEVAIQKGYQSARVNKDKPRFLEAIRGYMEHPNLPNVTGKAWMDAEADDGMAEAAWTAHAENRSHWCVIASRDKDLRIAPGLHFDFDTGNIEGALDTFGYIKVKTTTRVNTAGKTIKSHKPRGYGTKFFWWQMLMGDGADTITGIPRCGIVTAANMLEDCRTDYDALHVVKEAYKEYGKTKGFLHWETKEDALWNKVFISEAQMLWMQRTAGDINDVKKWMKEVIENGKR